MSAAADLRRFAIGPVVTVLHGSDTRPFCTLEQLYDILGYLHSDVPGSGEIDTYIEAARPYLAGEHPGLAAEPVPPVDASEKAVFDWLIGLGDKYGTPLPVTPLPLYAAGGA